MHMGTQRTKWRRAFVIATLVVAPVVATDLGNRLILTDFSHLGLTQPLVAEAFTMRDLALGSQGYDVDELQNRLGFLGYYHGKVDGKFGWQTYFAVRNFQSHFGMKVNGLVDLKTKQQLVAATANWHYQGPVHSSAGQTNSGSSNSGSSNSGASNSGASNSGASNSGASTAGSSNSGSSNAGGSNQAATAQATVAQPVPGITQSDINLMAHVVNGEARGEPYKGQVAIAAVILNRLKDPRFPHSIPAIIYHPGSFTCVSDGQVNLPPHPSAMKAVMAAIHGWDPSHGAVYYFNPATATNKWIWSRPEILQIGHHIFCS